MDTHIGIEQEEIVATGTLHGQIIAFRIAQIDV